jgi:hypothetical protein
MPELPRRVHWPRFSLSTLLFWIMPYIAVAAAISGWAGPYKSPFLNDHARWTVLLLWTALWAAAFLSGRAGKSRD